MKGRPTFQQLINWYLRRLAEVEREEGNVRGRECLRQHHAEQRGYSDGLRMLREILSTGYKPSDRLPEEMELPRDFTL